MTATSVANPGIYLGNVFRTARELLARRGVAILVGSFLVVGLGLALSAVLQDTVSQDLGVWGRLAVSQVRLLFQSILQAVVAGWTVLVALDETRSEGRTSSLRFAGKVIRRLPAVATCAGAIQIAVLLGVFALVIPGVILSLMWFVAIQAMVAEDLTIGRALTRSRQLTAERRAAIFGLQVIVIIGLIAINVPLFLLAGGGGSLVSAVAHPAVRYFWQPLLTAGENAVVCAIYAALYLELGGGSAASSTAEVFG